MRPITRHCRQDAIYWEAAQPSGQGGHIYLKPIGIRVRWQDAAGIVVSRSEKEWRPAKELITPILLKEHSLVCLGRLQDLSSEDVAVVRHTRELYRVGVAYSIPDIRARRVLYQAFIGRL